MKNKILITLLLFVGVLQAQDKKESYSFSLQQAIDHALEHNYSGINANRDIASAKQKKWETTAAGLPQISGAVNYTNNFKIQQNQFTINGVTNTLEFGNYNSMDGSLRLSQLIFDGSYIVALQASKTYLQYYQNAKLKTNTEIKEMVINAYGNVLLAEESVAILENNKTLLSKTLGDTQETFKNGLIEEENVEQLQITLATVNSSLNNAKRLQEIALKMLKVTLGIDIDANLTLTDKLDNLTTSNLDLAFSQSEFTVKNNINYQIATNFTDQRSLELKLQRSKALPTLAANVNFGYNAFDSQFNLFSQDQKWYNYSNLGVNLSVPIFSSFGRNAKTQQAKIALDQAKTQLTETEQQLKLQYEKAKSEYDFSIEEYATSKSNLNLAERIERKQQIKFTEGLSSSFDFSEAQRQLYTAQQNYLQSMVNIINKKAALEKIINKN
ncbi:MAG: TolC family protein [Flavobacterium sp.]|uniref:TolC family protein n=1 Tax=Flavobacterium sp. TaxID=239 RepID=UPI003267D46B